MTVLGAHPARLDLYVHAGDPVDVGVPVLDGDGVEITDLTGWACAAVATGADGTVLHDFAPTIVSGKVRVAATSTATAAWAWIGYAARLTVTATPPAGAPAPLTLGWVRLYRP